MRIRSSTCAGFASIILLLMLFITGVLVVLAMAQRPVDAKRTKEAAELDAKWVAACHARGGEIRVKTEKRLRFNYRNRYEYVTRRYCYTQIN